MEENVEPKVIGLLKNISELIVATLVEETDTLLKVKNPAFLGINGQNGQININFIPVEMLSLQPTVNLRNLLANPVEDLIFTFEKNNLLLHSIQLAKNVVDNYLALTVAKPASPTDVKSPAESNTVKLF